ncbi:MAG: Bug family tripartite tricarboxylate transporter substrate binding protein [Burkholderiaceae bacterium]
MQTNYSSASRSVSSPLAMFTKVAKVKLAAAGFAAFAPFIAVSAHAQGADVESYPNGPIRVIVGIGAGSNTDALGRLASTYLSERLGQPVVVQNKPGAGGTLGAEEVAKAKPDGYTLLWASSSIPMFPHLRENLRFDPINDLTGVGGVALGGLVMLTRPNAPWKSLAELIKYGKENPPRSITYASAGVGSNAHLFSEILAQSAGLELLHVPYKGSSAAVTDVMGGQIDFVFDGPSTAVGQIAAGNVLPLGFSTKERSSFLPDVPSVAEAGVDGYNQRTWLSFFAPAGTDKRIIEKLSQKIQEFVTDDKFRADLAKLSHEPYKLSADELTAMVAVEGKEWAKRLATLGIQKQ